MLRSLFNLLGHAWSSLLAALSTSTLSVIIFSLIVPIFIFIGMLVHNLRQGRKTGAQMKTIISGWD
jgi:hypothetical protein